MKTEDVVRLLQLQGAKPEYIEYVVREREAYPDVDRERDEHEAESSKSSA